MFAFLILILISGIGGAAEIFVQPPGSIQAAVNNASSGDIITVKPGTYIENIKVTKSSITIRSESGNPDNTIIKAKSTGANVLLLQGSNIKISGFKIVGAKSIYAGINLSSCSNCIIEKNKLLNNSRGIFLLRSSGSTVSANNVVNNGEYGIALQNAMGNTISGNTASGNQRGVYFGTSDDNVLSSNTVQSNSVYGFFTCGLSDRNRVYNNYFNNANMTIRNGIGNSYNTAKTAGTNIVGGPYIGGNFWGNPSGTGFSQTAVDNNGDGISDSAYNNITGSIYSDNLPLVLPSNPPTPTPPVASFSSNTTSGKEPLSVAFSDSSTGSPTAWNWSFGDATANSTQKNPTHLYSKAGSYTVKLTVKNAGGSSNTLTKTNYITVTANTTPTPLAASFSSNVTSGNVPLNVAFTDTSTGSPTSWNWSFGDATANSTQKNPTHLYSKAGSYTVKLTVKNAGGSSNTLTKTNYITVTANTTPTPLAASFSSNVTSGNVPLNVAFTDTSTGSPTSWNWNFGDGTANSTVKNPAHVYSNAGNYTVKLTVKNSAGSSNTVTKTNYIKATASTTVKPPVVSFWASRTSGTTSTIIGFTDASTNTPTAWNWNFGDGTYSTVKSPKHTYSKAGTYSITLTASNAAGSGTKTRSNYIIIT